MNLGGGEPRTRTGESKLKGLSASEFWVTVASGWSCPPSHPSPLSFLLPQFWLENYL